MERINILGQKYGRLTVVSYSKTIKQASFWECRCECGKIKIVASASLRYGLTNSCGCLAKERTSKRTLKHGESKSSKEYKAWEGIKSRCYTLSNNRYHRYGAIGIRVCDRWRESYENFLADMGRAPSAQHSIDRIKNEGNYEPGNCRWTTDGEQSNNKSNNVFLTHNGETKTLAMWAKALNISYKLFHKKIKYQQLSIADILKSQVELLKPI